MTSSFGQLEGRKHKTDDGPENRADDKEEDYEDHVVALDADEGTDFEGLIEGLPYITTKRDREPSLLNFHSIKNLIIDLGNIFWTT